LVHQSDVVIIGAGPIGCLAALSLAGKNITSIILDQAPNQTIANPLLEGRTIALSYSSVEFLKKLGLWHQIENKAAPILDIIVSNGLKGQKLHYGQRESNGLVMGFNVDLTHLKRVLLDAVGSDPLISLIAPFKASRLECSTHCVSVYDEEGKSVTATACFAADGKNSRTRQYLQLPIREWQYDQVAFVFNAKHELPHNNFANEAFLQTGPFASLPLVDPFESSIIWTLPTALSTEYKKLEPNEIQDLINETYPQLGALCITSPLWSYPLSGHRVSKPYKERVLLIGDAAHTMHPVAGQGLNVGIRDVITITPLVESYRRLGLDWGDVVLYREFCKKRRFDVQSMTIATDGLVRLFSNDSVTLNFLRNTGLKIVQKSSFLKRTFTAKAMGKGT
jgi:2-octaprenyl-6-methoxyphenol hydroxylase